MSSDELQRVSQEAMAGAGIHWYGFLMHNLLG